MNTFLSLLLLVFLTPDRLEAITCPIYHYSSWYEMECPHSSYCQNIHAVYSNRNGGPEIRSEVYCGWPDSQASTSEPIINAPDLPEYLRSIYNVRETKFCPYGEGRWCRMTPGPQSCWRFNCVILECRCNIDKCHAFMKKGGLEDLRYIAQGQGFSLFEEIERNTSGFGHIWRQDNGGKVPSYMY